MSKDLTKEVVKAIINTPPGANDYQVADAVDASDEDRKRIRVQFDGLGPPVDRYLDKKAHLECRKYWEICVACLKSLLAAILFWLALWYAGAGYLSAMDPRYIVVAYGVVCAALANMLSARLIDIHHRHYVAYFQVLLELHRSVTALSTEVGRAWGLWVTHLVRSLTKNKPCKDFDTFFKEYYDL